MVNPIGQKTRVGTYQSNILIKRTSVGIPSNNSNTRTGLSISIYELVRVEISEFPCRAE